MDDLVKYAFGILILIMATYYGNLAWTLFRQRATSANAAPTETGATAAGAAEIRKFADALDRAAREDKPVFVDFWATWCKNCLAMEETTFKDPDVEKRLRDFIVVKFQAEDPSAPAVKELLDRYGVLGLPTYVVLTP
jgi:thiol:disulfide interchange protein